jgi:hypothetical protein
VHSKEKGRLGRLLSFRALPVVSERRPGRLAQAFALLGIAYPKELHETDGLFETEPGGAHGQCRRDLLLVGEPCDALGDGGAKETVAEELWNLRAEPLEDLESSDDPVLSSLKRPCEGLLGELVLVVKILEKLELLFEGGLSGRIVTAQALELGLDPRPGFDDRPGARGALFPERDEALEAVDEKEPLLLFDDDERIIAVDLSCGAL